MEELTSQNQSLITLSITRQESVLSIKQALESDLPVLSKIVRVDGKQPTLEYIIKETVEFISINFPATQNMVRVAGEFAADVIETRPDWKLPDIKLFFKFIKRNQGLMEEMKSYGNVVTPRKFYEMANKYEEQRSIEREYLLDEKFKQPEQEKPSALAEKWLSGIYEQLAGLKRKSNYINPEVLRMSESQYETYLLENIPFASKEELIELRDLLIKHYATNKEGDKTTLSYHYPKAIEAIKNKLK